MTTLYNKVNTLYDKLTESIVYGLKLISKKPYLVQSCGEWFVIMKMMTTINALPAEQVGSLEKKCRKIGYQKFGEYMVKLIDKLSV